MIKFVLLSALLLASAFATLSSVNIQRVDIKENLYVPSTSKMHPVSLNNVDAIYPANVKIDNIHKLAVFDTTSTHNWHYQTEFTPAVNGTVTLSTCEGRSTLLKGIDYSIKEINIDGQRLKYVDVIKSNSLKGDSNTEITKKVQYGFGLDKSYKTNFFATLKNNGIKLKKQGFSFQVSPKINKVMFGAPQNFFSSGSLEVVPTQSVTNLWRVQVAKDSFLLKDLNALRYSSPQFAVFDSTTRYIWAEDRLVDSIIAQLNSKGLNCQDVNIAAPVGIYNCNDNTFPVLSLRFNGHKAETKPYILNKYADSIGNGKVRLLIRKAANYNAEQSQNVPNMTPSKTEYDLVLGTIFFENVYTYFNLESGNVELGQAIITAPQKHGFHGGARLWYLILGGVLLLAALAALLYLIKEVPFFGGKKQTTTVSQVRTVPQQIIPQQTVVTQQAYPQQFPVQQTSTQQVTTQKVVTQQTQQANTSQGYAQGGGSPVLLQSYVRPLNSVPAGGYQSGVYSPSGVPAGGQTYYVQQNPVQVSPTRVYQTSYVPK